MEKPKIIAQRQVGDFEVKTESRIIGHNKYISVSAEKNRPKIKRKKRSVFKMIQNCDDYPFNGILLCVFTNDPAKNVCGVDFESTSSDILGRIKPHLPEDVYELYESQVLLFKMQHGGK